MTKHMPAVPPEYRSKKGSWRPSGKSLATLHTHTPADALNTSEQGDAANIRQNTTNKASSRAAR
jgi:hypothetical protein